MKPKGSVKTKNKMKNLCQKIKLKPTSKNVLSLVVERLGKTVKKIGLFLEYVQFVYVETVYLVFITLIMRLFI